MPHTHTFIHVCISSSPPPPHLSIIKEIRSCFFLCKQQIHFTVEHANTKKGNTDTHTHTFFFIHKNTSYPHMWWTHSERDGDDFCGCTLLDSLGSLTMRDPRNVPWEVMWCRASRTFSRENTVRMDVSRVWGFSLNSRGLMNLMLKCSNLKKLCTTASVRDSCKKGGERTWWLWLKIDMYSDFTLHISNITAPLIHKKKVSENP